MTCNIFTQSGEAHDLVFAGFGMSDATQNDFKQANIAGKWVALIMENEVANACNVAPLLLAKAKQAKQNGAKGVFFIQRNNSNYKMAKEVVTMREDKYDIAEPAIVNSFPMLIINEKTAAAIFAVKKRRLVRFLDSVQQHKASQNSFVRGFPQNSSNA